MSDLKVLEGTDNAKAQGSWVYTDQGVASEQGFGHVSKDWYPKTMSYEDGIATIEEEKRQREDITFDAKHVEFIPLKDTVQVKLGDRVFTPSNWAAKQLCHWFGTPQTLLSFYKEPCFYDMEVIAHALQNGKRKYAEKGKDLLFRTYQDGTLRGVMSSKYSTVDNVWYLKQLQELIPGGRLSHWKGSADTIFGNILIPDTIRDGGDGDMGGMLSIGNCEIGKRVVFQTPSLFRAICMNGCIWGQIRGIELRQRHIRVDLEALRAMMEVNIGKQIPLLTIKLPEFLNLHNIKADIAMSPLFAAIAKQNNLASNVALEFMGEWNQHGAEKSAFGVVDAVTRAGQKFDADTWFTCDQIGGQILSGGVQGWERLSNFAKSLSDKEVNKVFGIAV